MTGRDELFALVDQLEFGVYTEADQAAIKQFRCAPYGDKPSNAAQRIIRNAADDPDGFGVDTRFIHLREAAEIVGVVIFGLEKADSPAVTVFVLGVKLSEHRRGIGTILKLIAMGYTAREPSWPNAVGSNVHRNNYRMNGLNAKLGVTSVPFEIDREYLLTGVLVDRIAEAMSGDSEKSE